MKKLLSEINKREKYLTKEIAKKEKAEEKMQTYENGYDFNPSERLEELLIWKAEIVKLL